jgi:hypothetical protein
VVSQGVKECTWIRELHGGKDTTKKVQKNSNKKTDAGMFPSYAPSSTDVNEEGPLRGWHAFSPELRHGFVNSVCDSVQVKVLVFKETLIEPACNVWAIFVMHHPASCCVIIQMMYLWLSSAHHIVPMTLRNPQKSIDAAK